MERNIVVFAVDTGSKKDQSFTWVSSHAKDHCGHDLAKLVDAIVSDLDKGEVIGLGFECVLSLPCPEHEDQLGQARDGECTHETENRPFTAAAGACATMIGLPQLGWLLREIKQRRLCSTATTRWDDFVAGRAEIFVWEAFVSGFEKGHSHHADAVLAVESFEKNCGTMATASRVSAANPISLVGALILWACLSEDMSLLHHAATVLRPVLTPEVLAENERRIRAERAQRRQRNRG